MKDKAPGEMFVKKIGIHGQKKIQKVQADPNEKLHSLIPTRVVKNLYAYFTQRPHVFAEIAQFVVALEKAEVYEIDGDDIQPAQGPVSE